MVKLFIDFDNTIADTTSAFCEYYNTLYIENDDDRIRSKDITEYDFSDVGWASGHKLGTKTVSEEMLLKGFKSDLLFSYLKPYQGVRYALEGLKSTKLFEIYLVSNCSDESAVKKIEWLKKWDLDRNFDGKVFLNINQAYNKSLLNMKDGILVDDHRANHLNSNAKYKYCFRDYPHRKWHPKIDDGVKLFDKWSGSDSLLLELISIGVKNK